MNDLTTDLAETLVGAGGFLRCEKCGTTRPLSEAAPVIGGYLAQGWPTHHGQTMRWWTQRQIDAGEVPSP